MLGLRALRVFCFLLEYYPETGSHNKSAIHWDMICDLRTDSEILVDGELFYKNGEFVFDK